MSGPVAYPRPTVSPTVVPSPILPVILAAIGEGADAEAVVGRLVEDGLRPEPGVVEARITDAMALGLVRVAGQGPRGQRYVLTSLGSRQLAERGISSDDADRLRELETLRTDLAATIAHELRTPLTAIRTCAGLLLDADSQPTPAQHRTLVETIERNAERMQRVVADILDLARFRTGAISLQPRRFDLVAMADAAVASLAPMAAARGLTVTIVADERPVPVYADHRRLEQALVNLLSNAQRFAERSVSLTVASAGERATIAVRDDGPGIPEADQARLFERFFVGRRDVSAARDGVGLGLPTALAIAGAHGGTIEVVSSPGRGSTFTLVIPVAGPTGGDGDD